MKEEIETMYIGAITFGYYQQQTETTAIYPRQWPLGFMYAALGLGEAGEVQNKVKKVIRDHHSILTPEMKDAIAKEIGGVLYYCSQLATEIGVPLQEIAKQNLEILADRQRRGTLQGSGDNR